jgi:hypothetical protein
MKSTYTFFLLLVFTSVLTSCRFDLFEDFELSIPSITIDMIENNSFNETVVTFTTKESENRLIEYMGFGLNTEGNPKIDERQTLFSGEIGTFTTNLGILSSDSIYYFIPFAANEDGLFKGTIYEYAVPEPIAIEAPCTVISNTINDGGSNYSVTRSEGAKFTGASYNYIIVADYFSTSGRRRLQLNFNKKPITARYLTSEYTSFSSKPDGILVTFEATNESFTPNKEVYISIDENDNATIEFCDFEYTFFSTTFDMKGSFTAKLK